MPLALGSRLGPYEIVSLIGSGGMGEVYRARDTRLDRDVAIKVLPEAFAADANRVRRFEQEARAIAALRADLRPAGVWRRHDRRDDERRAA
jgi:serine/threonine protein kinase